MTRPTGFAIADHSTGFMTDERVLRAVRRVGHAAAVAYLAVRDASWSRGERVAVADAVEGLPRAWFAEAWDVDETIAVLTDVGLVDADGCIPETTWDAWYKPAEERRQRRVEAGRLGGRAKRRSSTPQAKPERRSSNAKASPKQSSTIAVPDRPSVVASYEATDGLSSVSPAPAKRGEPAEPVRRVTPVNNQVDCDDYVAHSFEHYRLKTGGFICGICYKADRSKVPEPVTLPRPS